MKFYRIFNLIIKYKNKGKIVRGIGIENCIKFGKYKNNEIKHYFVNLHHSVDQVTKIENIGIFNFRGNIECAIRRLSRSEAIGLDSVPGNILRQDKKKPLMMKLKSWFEEWIHKGSISTFLMWGKLLLINKEESNCPIIENVRPRLYYQQLLSSLNPQ